VWRDFECVLLPYEAKGILKRLIETLTLFTTVIICRKGVQSKATQNAGMASISIGRRAKI